MIIKNSTKLQKRRSLSSLTKKKATISFISNLTRRLIRSTSYSVSTDVFYTGFKVVNFGKYIINIDLKSSTLTLQVKPGYYKRFIKLEPSTFITNVRLSTVSSLILLDTNYSGRKVIKYGTYNNSINLFTLLSNNTFVEVSTSASVLLNNTYVGKKNIKYLTYNKNLEYMGSVSHEKI